jgi:hypothetical protein
VVQARTCGEWLQLRVLLPDGSGGGSSSRWKEARNVCCRLPGNRVQLLQACEKSGVVLFVAGDGRLCLYSVDIEMVVPQVRLVLDGLPDGVRWPGRWCRESFGSFYAYEMHWVDYLASLGRGDGR